LLTRYYNTRLEQIIQEQGVGAIFLRVVLVVERGPVTTKKTSSLAGHFVPAHHFQAIRLIYH